MNDRQSFSGVRFSPDFAARVLIQAGAISRRRRKWQMAGVSVAAASIVIAALWSVPSRDTAPLPAAPAAQITDASEFASTGETETEPLQWMFPDAQPVAQFADQYSKASTGGVEQRQQLLFADETERSRAP